MICETKRSAKKLKKASQPSGLWLRGDVYYARFWAHGEFIQRKLSADRRVAEEMLADLRLKTYRRSEGMISNDYPIDALERKWLAHCEQALRPKTVRRYRQNLKKILGALTAKTVAQISTDMVVTYRADQLAKEVAPSPRTINMDVGALSTMLAWGVEHKLIGRNPLEKLDPLPHDHVKEGRALSVDEVHELLAAASEHYQPIWYAYLTTGLRRDELTRLAFGDIDWEGRELIVRSGSAKNHSERRIPVDDSLYATLEAQRKAAAARMPGVAGGEKTTARIAERLTVDRVFTTGQNTPLGGNVYREFMATCARAKIETLTTDEAGNTVEHVDLHSLRRTFATDLITNGADPKTVQYLLGHRTLEMTMKLYAKVRTHSKWQAIGRLSYGAGTTTPAHLLAMPGMLAEEKGGAESNTHTTDSECKTA